MSITPRLQFLLAATLLLGVAGQWTEAGAEGYWLFPLLMLLVLVFLERLWLPRSGLTLQRSLLTETTGRKPRLELGVKGHYQLSIQNQTARTLDLECQTAYDPVLHGDDEIFQCRIAAGETQTLKREILATALGEYPLGDLYYRIKGGFGLVWWSRRFKTPLMCPVEPAGFALDEKIPVDDGESWRSLRHRAVSGTELLTLRDYEPGDPANIIDWKATARRGRPLVRTFSREQRLELLLLLDCGRHSRLYSGQMDRLHHYVNVASRLAQLAILHQEDRVGFIAYADSVLSSTPVAGGIRGLSHLNQVLGKTSAVAKEANPLSAAMETRRLLRHRGLVLFLTDIDQPEADSQLIRAVQLLRIKHQVLVVAIEDEAIRVMRQGNADDEQGPYDQFAALEYQRNRELNRRRLQRMGVVVVSALPQQVDQLVLKTYLSLRMRAVV